MVCGTPEKSSASMPAIGAVLEQFVAGKGHRVVLAGRMAYLEQSE